ncbi:MAG: O-antigen ligase family protein [Candidatus Moranbacteria bacterium]|nr:O-antigen ligase family protein [Candidatus Moranbacteria bacterium]
MLKVRSVILFCIALCVLSLPLVQLKTSVFGIPLYSVEMPLLVALVAYLYGWWRGAFSPFKNIHFRDPFVIGVALFFLGVIVSFVANPFSLMGLGMLKTWFAFPLLMAWLLFQLCPSEQERNFLLDTWFITTLLVACGAIVYMFINSLTYDGRLVAWFISPNYLAIFIAPGTLIAFYKLRKVLEEKEFKKHFLPVASLLILLLTLFFTHSYGVWFGVFGAAMLMVFLPAQALTKKFFWKVIITTVIALGIFYSLEHNDPKWQSLVTFGERSSMASRIMIWQSAGKMIADNPVFGIGLGRFQEVYLEYQKYYSPYLEWAVPQPHNIVLAVWLQTGLIGFVGFILLVSRAIALLIKNKNRESILFLGLLALYLIYGLFDTPYFKTDLAFAFWLVIALILTLPRSEAELQK